MSDITIAITTIGRPSFPRTALPSVQNQVGEATLGGFIASENSIDRRAEEAGREFPDLRIRYVFRQPTLPMLAHRFSTFRQARTPYIANLNDDDWWNASHVADGLGMQNTDSSAVAHLG
jgi:hypothetical protein